MSAKAWAAGAAIAGCTVAAVAIEHEKAQPSPVEHTTTVATHSGFPWATVSLAVLGALAAIAAVYGAVRAWRWWRDRPRVGRLVPMPERLALPAAPRRAIESGAVPISAAIEGWKVGR